MPFDIQLKGFLIGFLFAWFAVPFILGLVNKPHAAAA